MASARRSGDERDELAQGLPAAGAAPLGGEQPDLPRPLGDRATEAMSGSPATNEPIGDAAREARMHRAASRLLLVGGVLFVIGLIISLIADGGLSDGIGVAFMFLALVPTLAGVAMELSVMVNRRGRRGGSFA
jgi:hypothetical protein